MHQSGFIHSEWMIQEMLRRRCIGGGNLLRTSQHHQNFQNPFPILPQTATQLLSNIFILVLFWLSGRAEQQGKKQNLFCFWFFCPWLLQSLDRGWNHYWPLAGVGRWSVKLTSCPKLQSAAIFFKMTQRMR